MVQRHKVAVSDLCVAAETDKLQAESIIQDLQTKVESIESEKIAMQ